MYSINYEVLKYREGKMRRDWIAVAGISLACVITWSLLFIVFFRTGDEGVDSSIAINEEAGFYHEVDQVNEEEDNTNSTDHTSLKNTGETDSSMVEVEQGFNDDVDHEVTSSGSLVNDDTNKLTLDNIRDRGIHIGDFDHIAPGGIISIDVILREILEEEG
jgi:hypothetical protein